MYKRWVINFFILNMILLLCVVIFNYQNDPYQYYGINSRNFYMTSEEIVNERFQNPGLIRHGKYDTILTGTSMTENFKKSVFDKNLHTDYLKVPLSGGTSYELKYLLQLSLLQHKAKNIFFGFDIFSFYGSIDREYYGKNTFPIYLYTTSLSDKIKYLLNIDITRKSYDLVHQDNNKTRIDFDRAYSWNDRCVFGSSQVMKDWNLRNNTYNASFDLNEHKFEILKRNFDENILPIIQHNPEVTFTFFFPPYSILTWKLYEEQKWLDDALKFKKYVITTFSKYDNIKCFDFQTDKNVIFNFNLYRDIMHYNESINDFMVINMKNNQYIVNSSNIDMSINTLKKQIQEFKINK